MWATLGYLFPRDARFFTSRAEEMAMSRLSRARARLRELAASGGLAASEGRAAVDRPGLDRESMEAVERDG